MNVCKDCWNEQCKNISSLVEDKIKIGKCVETETKKEIVKEKKFDNTKNNTTIE